jgi:hypothetical protein
MKKYLLKITALTLFMGVIAGCESENVVYDNINGQVGIKFEQTSYTVTVQPQGTKVTIPVSVTTLSTVDRTFEAVADETSTGGAASYAIGTATVPAGSYAGTLDVDFNTTSLADGVVYKLLVKLVAPVGGSAFANVATINYNKKIVCNDVVLTITTDQYAEETGWKIVNASGVVIASVPIGTYGPASAVSNRGKVYTYNINLPNGRYSLIMEDAFGDGQSDGVYNGGYKLNCSIIVLAEGTGAYGFTKVIPFDINP